MSSDWGWMRRARLRLLEMRWAIERWREQRRQSRRRLVDHGDDWWGFDGDGGDDLASTSVPRRPSPTAGSAMAALSEDEAE